MNEQKNEMMGELWRDLWVVEAKKKKKKRVAVTVQNAQWQDGWTGRQTLWEVFLFNRGFLKDLRR